MIEEKLCLDSNYFLHYFEQISNNPTEYDKYKNGGILHAFAQVILKFNLDYVNCLDHYSSFDEPP